MALIKCQECGKEISDSASFCPGCGAPIESSQPKKGDWIPFTDQEVAVMLSKKKKKPHPSLAFVYYHGRYMDYCLANCCFE